MILSSVGSSPMSKISQAVTSHMGLLWGASGLVWVDRKRIQFSERIWVLSTSRELWQALGLQLQWECLTRAESLRRTVLGGEAAGGREVRQGLCIPKKGQSQMLEPELWNQSNPMSNFTFVNISFWFLFCNTEIIIVHTSECSCKYKMKKLLKQCLVHIKRFLKSPY
jgi:hypothetical protein